MLIALTVPDPLLSGQIQVTILGWVHGVAWLGFVTTAITAAIQINWSVLEGSAQYAPVGAPASHDRFRHLDGTHQKTGAVEKQRLREAGERSVCGILFTTGRGSAGV